MKIKLTPNDIHDIENIEALFHSTVIKIGNGGMVKAYKKYIGKQAIVVILMDDPRQKRKISQKTHKQIKKDFKEEFSDL